jgi:hypothetical protein
MARLHEHQRRDALRRTTVADPARQCHQPGINAGAAIEVLGLKTPQTTNIEIRNSRFIRNNTARKLGPSEIFIWGGVRDPSVCCSTGAIHGNHYATLPGVGFFTNEAPQLTSWTLTDNTGYPTVAAIDRAMPCNRPPLVAAGADLRTDQLRIRPPGNASDDGKPTGRPPSTCWEALEGPGPVAFEDPAAPDTTATFDTPGELPPDQPVVGRRARTGSTTEKRPPKAVAANRFP